MDKLFITILASSLLLLTGGSAGAQTARARIADTPIRGEANLASAIVATLQEGDPVDVVDLQGDWYRVIVPNEQGKPRVGYVLAHLVELVATDRSPQSVPAPASSAAQPAAQGPPIPPTLAELARQRTSAIEHEQALKALALERDNALEFEQALRAEADALRANPNAIPKNQQIGQTRSARIPKPVAPHPQTREGIWFNGGFGFGSMCRDECDGRLSGGSGGLSLGGTISDRLLLGGGTTGFYRSVQGVGQNVGTMDARLLFYPIRTSGFFVTGGLGLGHISTRGQTEYGVGAVIGLGWDIPIQSNLSLTPFWNGIGVSASSSNAGVGQIGLGITVR